MYFGSGSVVAAANVLLVVALVVVALLVMPLIHDRAVRLIMQRFRGAAGRGVLGKLTSSRPRLRIRRLKHDGAGRPTKRAPVGRS